MTADTLAVAVLLGCAAAVGWLCAVGVLVMRGPYARLHYLGPAATLAPALVVAAVLVRHSSTQACIKGVLIFAAVLVINPVLAHVTARAARTRQAGRRDLRDSEEGEPS